MIGRVVKTVVDKSRKEILSSEEKMRSFPVSIYYPTEETGTSTMLELFKMVEEEIIHIFSLLEVERTKLEQLITPFENNATPVKNKAYPVVLLSPAFGLDRDLYVELITKIVESGYVVVTISAPYDSIYTVFPNGELIYQTESFPSLEEQIQIRVDDVQCVLAELEKWNKDSQFYGMFDLNKICGMGHSLGGATMYNLATIDSRIKCVVLLDASLHLINDNIPSVPVLNLRQEATTYKEYLEAIGSEQDSERIATKYIENLKRLYDKLPNKQFIKVNGAQHLSFSTFANLIGEVPLQVTTTIQSLVVHYLNQNVKGIPAVFDQYIKEEIHFKQIDGLGNPIK